MHWGVIGSIFISAASVAVALLAGRKAGRAQEAAARAQELAAQAERRSAAALEEIAARNRPPAIAWRIEHYERDEYVLVNTGTETATGVEITGPRNTVAELQGLHGFEQGTRLGPNETAAFALVPFEEVPAPTHLRVKCDQHPEYSSVQVPARYR